MLDRASGRHFMRTGHQAMWCSAATPQEAIEALYRAPEWDGRLSKLAVI